MLYPKLMLRGVLRYRKKGKRLFILISLVVTATLFALSFKRSFYTGYEDLGIDTRYAHLNVVSPQSFWFQNAFSLSSGELPLISIDKQLEDFIAGMQEVQVTGRAVETEGFFYTLTGEFLNGYNITGIDPHILLKLLPGTRIVAGDKDFSYDPTRENISILRWNIQSWEQVTDNYHFLRSDFRYQKEQLEDFKNQVKQDFPSLFTDKDINGVEGTDIFISVLNNALTDAGLYKRIPEHFFTEYDYRIDDSIYYIKSLGKDNQDQLPKLNKRLFQVLYPEAIIPVPDEIRLNNLYTLQVPPAKSIEALSMPKYLPIRIVGFVEGMPLYFAYNYLDIGILQQYLELSPEECTTYYIRLKNKSDTPIVKQKIEEYLKHQNLDYRVIDYIFTGKFHMATAMAFDMVLNFLIALFLIIVMIFVIKTIMLAIIKRRKEIATSVTLGMNLNENIIIFMGEMAVVVTLSWFAGALLGTGLILLFSQVGIPGVIFFPDGLLFPSLYWEHYIYAYLLVIGTSLAATFFPLLSIKKLKAVDIFKEAR